MNLTKLAIEMIVVGISLVVVSAVVSKQQGEENLSQSKHWKDMVMWVFISGALLHFLFELFGINEWYVKRYKPLLK